MENKPNTDSDFRAITLDTADGDKPEKVIKQAEALLGGKKDEYAAKFIKKPAYKRLDRALRKIGQEDKLNEITKKALEKK